MNKQTRRRDRSGQCDGKLRYASWGDAKRAARRVMRHDDGYVNPYNCPHCRSVHVGHATSGRVMVRVAASLSGRRQQRLLRLRGGEVGED